MVIAPPRPLPIKDRLSYLFLERGQVDVLDGAFVLVDKDGVRTHIPVGSLTCMLLEPGIRITHEAVKLAARTGCLLIWVGEAGVRLYSAGQPGGARADRLLYQAGLALDEQARLRVVRKMYAVRFGEEPPARRSVDQLRGIEGIRVRKLYQSQAKRHGVAWRNRQYDPKKWDSADPLNRALSSATACLYGLCEAAILAAGYAPSVGFIHTGKPRSFVFDIADLVKFETVVPLAFEVVAKREADVVRATRLRCRDVFRKAKLLGRLVPLIDEILSAGEMDVPEIKGVVPTAFADKEGSGDAGHRG